MPPVIGFDNKRYLEQPNRRHLDRVGASNGKLLPGIWGQAAF
jgi:hypothetical protein